MTPIGDGAFIIHLQSKVTVPQKTPKVDNRDGTATRHGNIHVKTHESSIKAPREGNGKTLKRRYGGHLTAIGRDVKTPYGDGNNTLSRDKGTHSTFTRAHHYSERAP